MIIISRITGFVGRNLKDYLKSEFDILGVSRTKVYLGNGTKIDYHITIADNTIIKAGTIFSK
ncbi:hypothetical protein [Tenacibaculum ovolyticum]|uniref:hypothetical protein n=1 Tax=Tenacibaculum ovolyticum TaxID=104270 RepID=UPI003BAC81D6